VIRRALFPRLLGEGFASLHPQVRMVHSGQSRRWTGLASVQRGSHLLARIATAMAGLPSTQHQKPVTVSIEASNGREVWTRHFGDGAPMRSTLFDRGGVLVESMGALTLEFQVNVQDGGMSWYLRRVALLGIPMPHGLFQVQARVDGGKSYRFFVAVALAGIGELIRYEGELGDATPESTPCA
jgi:hypothetical protein